MLSAGHRERWPRRRHSREPADLFNLHLHKRTL